MVVEYNTTCGSLWCPSLFSFPRRSTLKQILYLFVDKRVWEPALIGAKRLEFCEEYSNRDRTIRVSVSIVTANLSFVVDAMAHIFSRQRTN